MTLVERYWFALAEVVTLLPLSLSVIEILKHCREWYLIQSWFPATIIFAIFFSFSIRVFFHGHWRLTGRKGKGGDHFLFHSATFTRSPTFRHLFSTLHVKWISYIFNRNACIYQTATRWDFTTLSNYHLIDWWCEVCFSLLTWWFDTRFCYGSLDTGNRWPRTCIDYHPCITSKPTNQVC